MQHEQSRLPSYDETTPFISSPQVLDEKHVNILRKAFGRSETSSITDAEIERRLKALRENPITRIIDTTKMMDTSVNPLSEEDKEIQIERVQNLIRNKYPNAHLKKIIINFSYKKTMDIVVIGPKGGETKIVLDDGSGLQSKFLNLSFVKKVLGPPAEQICPRTTPKICRSRTTTKRGRKNQCRKRKRRN